MTDLRTKDQDILEQMPTPVLATDRDLKITFMNAAGCQRLGKEKEELIGMPCYEVLNSEHCQDGQCGLSKAMQSGEIETAQTKATFDGQQVPVEYTSMPLQNDQKEITGALQILVDISNREVKQENDSGLKQEMRETSTPVLTLASGVLAVPLVGTLDSYRTQQVMEMALTRLSQDKASVLIIDITGVPVIDTMVANHLIQMVAAVRLMGAESILTGISPETARTIVHLGIDLSNLKTRTTLAYGLRHALEMVNEGRDV